MNYGKLQRDISRFRDSKSCALVAVCALTKKPYEEVYDDFRDHGRKRGKPTPTWMTRQILAQYGYTLLPMIRIPKSVNQCETKLAKSGKYLIQVRDHILACVNGRVEDWTRGRKHRPIKIYRVVKKRRT